MGFGRKIKESINSDRNSRLCKLSVPFLEITSSLSSCHTNKTNADRGRVKRSGGGGVRKRRDVLWAKTMSVLDIVYLTSSPLPLTKEM